MFCSKCGNSMPDGSAFCANCGNSTAQSTSAPRKSDPRPVAKNKKEWLMSYADAQTKKRATLSLILTAVTTLILIAALCITYFGPFYNIPVIKTIIGDEMIAEFKDLQQEALDADDDLHRTLDKMDISMDDALEDSELEDAYDSAIAFVENPSLCNIRNILGYLDESEITSAFNLILSILTFPFVFIALFSILGGLLKVKGLLITALVLCVPVLLMFGGIVFLALMVVALSFQIWALSQVSGAYKAYCLNPRQAC